MLRRHAPAADGIAGNDLSRTFRWGDAYEKKWIRDHITMYETLRNVRRSARGRGGIEAFNSRATRRIVNAVSVH